jgi:hypothetical protein
MVVKIDDLDYEWPLLFNCFDNGIIFGRKIYNFGRQSYKFGRGYSQGLLIYVTLQ